MRVAPLLVALASAVGLVACAPAAPQVAVSPPEVIVPAPASATPAVSISPPSPAPPVEGPVLAESAAKELQGFLSGLKGEAGVAIVRPGTAPVVVGKLTSGVAWSTAKVPVVIATSSMKGASLKRWRQRAITASDNDAANELWKALGTPEQAASRATAVLRAGGDVTTVINAKKTRPDFSAFGQTEWTITDAAAFAGRLPCLPEASETYALMGHITPEHSWGLGRIKGAHFKGGWGPVGKGYLVRQMGVITLDDGSQVGVALITTAPDLAQGSARASSIADWIKAHMGDLTGGSCTGVPR